VDAYSSRNKKTARYVKGLFRSLRRVALSEEGYWLTKKVLLHCAKHGFAVASARQDPGLSSKPDLVAVSVDKSTWMLPYSKSVAIEIESCNEVETYPEQVARNRVKEGERLRGGAYVDLGQVLREAR